MPTRILLVHNRYLQVGGEDSVYETEKRVLTDRGHEVLEFTDHNERVREIGGATLAANLLWSHSRRREFAALLEKSRPDLVHIHNLYYMLGPGIYYACRRSGIPMVQTLHNFRLGCINGRMSRHETPCELCGDLRFRWPGIVKRCFQESLPKSAALTLAVDLHRSIGTWRNQVDLYIALSEFARGKHIRNGVPPTKIVVKPNCVPSDPGAGPGDGNSCLFVGRLERDKGIETLLESAAWLPSGVDVTIVGDGPLAPLVRSAVQTKGNVRCLGQQPRAEVLRLMKQARLLLFPTLAYENFPVVIAEAFATGLPVVGSRLGSTQEIVREGVTGALFPPGNAEALGRTANRLLSDLGMLARLRANARAEYEGKYTADACYTSLMNIYAMAEKGALEPSRAAA